MPSIPQTTTPRTERPGPRVEAGPLALLAAVVRVAEKDARCRGHLGEHAAAWLADIRGKER